MTDAFILLDLIKNTDSFFVLTIILNFTYA